MAPSRRKGGSKASAAAAAAAARKWKVGDLVLAKLKGFPAWPATVSEPEKWGYPADWKKVVVHFFGTEQIAFCNPADIEAFTEEKKESLLTKRHGKGSDFVRAVHEIIDSYEKLKIQEQVVDTNSGDNVTMANAGNSVESLYDMGLKDRTEDSVGTLNICQNSSYCAVNKDVNKDEPILPVEDAKTATPNDALHSVEPSSVELSDNLVVTGKAPVAIYSSRKRLGGVQSKSCDAQKRVPSARRSKNSSRIDSHRLQKLLPLSNGKRNAEDVSGNLLRAGSVRRNKRSRKSPKVSKGHGSDSPDIVSNGVIEENGSEVVTVDSDSFSLNEGSTIESGCELRRDDSTVDCCKEDVELSQTPNIQTTTIVFKKKRMLNRKRVTNDAIMSDGLDHGAELEMHGSGQIFPDGHERMSERYSKEDGDEHLPLVKRARVRMGRSSPADEEVDTFIQSEEKIPEMSNSLSGRICTSLCSDEDSVADRNSFVVKDTMDNSSPSNKCPQFSVDKPRPCEGKKSPQFCCLVDGEAALPPSKRLHRALEAMSANAAEYGKKCSELPSAMKTSINTCLSSTRDHSHIVMESKTSNNCEVQNVKCFTNIASQDDTTTFSTSLKPPILEESAKSMTVLSHDRPLGSSSSPKQDFCKMLEEGINGADHKDHGVSSLDNQTAGVMVVAQSLVSLSPNHSSKRVDLGCSQGLSNQMLSFKDGGENGHSKSDNHKMEGEIDPSERSGMSSDHAADAVEIVTNLQQNGTESLLNGAEVASCDPTKSCEIPSDESNRVNGILDIVKKINGAQKDLGAIPSPSLAEVTVAAVQDPLHLSHSVYNTDDYLDDKDASGTRSSLSPSEGLNSPAQSSPPGTSIRNVSTSDNGSFLGNKDCCYPDTHLHLQKLKVEGKGNNKAEATASLASFEAILGTLTRTKESIGRATRIAIDCAKFGTAAKVVEILARNLESESSLHRKVDLFFLVDSIAQCSRGLKGNVGGMYLSAIQAILHRLLLAVAPLGSNAHENRRQCLKVLRLWLERKIFPDSIIRHHIRDLDSHSCSSAFSRRPLRTERAFDDPIREMEGAIVNEYGSNSSFQLPGFRMPPMLKDEGEGSDSDGGSFEAVTPEHESKSPEKQERTPLPAFEKRRHILEDVDGELEMEDVAPSFEAEMNSASNVGGVNAAQASHLQFEQHFPLPYAPPLPKDVPPSSPPLPTSPPPLPPPPLPPAILDPKASGVNSNIFLGAHGVQDCVQQSIMKQSLAPGINPTVMDAAFCHASECKDLQMEMHRPDSASSCSFTGLPTPHAPIRPLGSVRQTDGAGLHENAFHLRPPHHAPSSQFSYVQADQRLQSQREVPPLSYPNRFQFVPDRENGNSYSDHDSMKLTPREPSNSWRFPVPSFPGSYYHDSARIPSSPAPYAGPPCEPAMLNHRWAFPPRAMHRGEFIPHRPPSEGPIPVAIRGQSLWQPR